MRNIRLVVAYDGTDFHGWQRQPGLPTVQACVEAAIERLTGQAVSVHGSGRTDAGVHASNLVANFKTDCRIPCENLLKALNHLLPPSVRVKEACEAPEDFNARHDARSKTYLYRILLAPVASPFLARFVLHYPYPLDRERMQEAAPRVEGEHDFTSFAGSAKEARSAPLDGDGPLSMVRTVFSSRILWRPKLALLIYEVRGSGFLQHMVRNLAGTLLEVGQGKRAPDDIHKILIARDRRLAGPTAPAQGLCLMKVEY